MKKTHNTCDEATSKSYITLSDFEACSFRKVAETMTQRGFKMNHSHARGLLHQALAKVAKDVGSHMLGESATQEQVDNLVNSEGFHRFIMTELEEFDGSISA